MEAAISLGPRVFEKSLELRTNLQKGLSGKGTKPAQKIEKSNVENMEMIVQTVETNRNMQDMLINRHLILSVGSSSL